MSLYRRFIHTGRVADCVAIVLLALWITVSILWVELAGFPYLYGWPLLVLRPPGYDQPHAWVWVVDLLAACLSLGSTWVVAIRICRARMRGLQFRLATLLSVA